ncbi:fibronectin type III domain-containing protein [Cohnella zeiphila]|uniref:Right-handed parallel beta-helix repeat-containing protein n=1 Tax=Cohnella zeiphila TaxID=2761120 RepID=A0A7X0VYR3_9BACL|nr:fibronectin type III domain-containing protein [Cohnella zeiphila]MBB6735276.1 right-handed parallel beta-helix repeat-containing protein [Cohnella zeiphila]
MKASKRWKAWLLAVACSLALQMAAVGIGGAGAAEASDAGTTYYVDSAAGNDSNSGTSAGQPWRTLSHVSSVGGAGLFRPGDQILLKSGGVWNSSFDVTFSGSADGQITIGSYGGDAKPIINGGGGSYAVRIENRQYVTLQDIEITNYNAANYDDYKSDFYRRSGVWVISHHEGPMSSIELKSLDIHDVTGISVSGEDWVTDTDGETVNKNANAAIQVNAWEWEPNVAADKHAYFNGLTIENSYIHDIRTIGINVDGYMNDTALYHKNIVVRNNTIDKTGSDGIVIGVAENPLIENNAVYDVGINSYDFKWIAGVWVWKTNGATFRHNEVARVHYLNAAQTDSSAFDTDIQAQGDHIFEYNYSHDNAGGFVMDMGQLQNGTNYYRYNISRNDRHFRASGNTVEVHDNGVFYNNVFYNDNGDGILLSDNPKSTYINNIFYTAKGSKSYPAGPAFYNNDFYGSTPPSQGVRNLSVDPKFVDPSGGDGMDKANGFRLSADSPLIGEGRVVDGNGGLDFGGNPLYTGSPDIGAFEDPASTKSDSTPPDAPAGLQVKGRTDTTVTLAWTASENGVPLDADIFNAATDEKLASVMMGNSVTLTGLSADTDYSFYVVARDLSGNESAPSSPVAARTTSAAVVVDDADAAKAGTWTAAAGGYRDGYVFAAKGSGTKTVTWTPNLAQDGYYGVYIWLPPRAGNESRATNAAFRVQFDGGSKAYTVNEYTSAAGQWVLLGNHKFKAGTEGSVAVSDLADDKVVADAVKFQYLADFGPDSISKVAIMADKPQLRVGDSTSLSVVGSDESGRTVDLRAEGVAIAYSSDAPAIATVSGEGIVAGQAAGTAHIRAVVTLGGRQLASNDATVIVGSGLTVTVPSFTDGSGAPIAALQPGGIVKVSTTIVNSTDADRSVTLIAGVYNADGLLLSDTESANVKSFTTGTLTATLVLPADLEGASIRAFVWDGKGTMHPLLRKTEFSG